MGSGLFWTFQHQQANAKVAQQDIVELTTLAAALLAFEHAYLTTHWQRTPVFKLLSMINVAIAENTQIIERELVQRGAFTAPEKDESEFPF